MLQDSSLLAEAQRQFMICSACRYCEGYCATFPAIEARTDYAAADVAYIANVCHDCRACHQACMYTSPHPFAVDIPKLLTELRVETYEERSAPAFGTGRRARRFGLVGGRMRGGCNRGTHGGDRARRPVAGTGDRR
jgi:citrate/tricarballylate utilization protein